MDPLKTKNKNAFNVNRLPTSKPLALIVESHWLCTTLTIPYIAWFLAWADYSVKRAKPEWHASRNEFRAWEWFMSNFCWLMAFNENWDVTVMLRLSLRWLVSLLKWLFGRVMWMFMKIIPHEAWGVFSARLLLSLVPCHYCKTIPYKSMSHCWTCY